MDALPASQGITPTDQPKASSGEALSPLSREPLPNPEEGQHVQQVSSRASNLEKQTFMVITDKFIQNKTLTLVPLSSADRNLAQEKLPGEFKKRKKPDSLAEQSASSAPAPKKQKIETGKSFQTTSLARTQQEPDRTSIILRSFVTDYKTARIKSLQESNEDILLTSHEESTEDEASLKGSTDFITLTKKPAEEFTSNDFATLHELVNSKKFSTDRQLIAKKEELLHQINSKLWAKESGTMFDDFIKNNLPIKDCPTLCCIHHTLLSLQIDGASTPTNESPLQLYKNNMRDNNIDYFQALEFNEEKRLLKYNGDFEEALACREDGKYAAWVKYVLQKQVKDPHTSIVPKNRIFCTERPEVHTWFANQSGQIFGNIFTSLNIAQSPARQGQNLASIMQSNDDGSPFPTRSYELTQTLYSDLFVVPPKPSEDDKGSSSALPRS